MKHYPKAIAVVLLMLLLFSLAACGEAQVPAETTQPNDSETVVENTQPEEQETQDALPYEGVELSVWMAPIISIDDDMAFYTEQFAKFTERTGATVTVEMINWDNIAAKYMTAFMSDTAADVLYLAEPYTLIENNNLLDLGEYWSEEEISHELFWDATAYQGKHYGVPYVGGAAYRALLCNMDLLNECGVTEIPQTWDDFLAACEAVKQNRPDVYPFLVPVGGTAAANPNMSYYFFLYQAGGSLANEDASAYALDTPEALETMQFIKTLVDHGYLSTDCIGLDSNPALDLFYEGKVAMTCTFPAKMKSVEDAGFNMAATTGLTNKTAASLNPVDLLSVNASTENPQAAVDLVKFIISEEFAVAMNEELYMNGQLRDYYPAPTYPDYLDDVFAHPERAFVYPIIPSIQTVHEAVGTNMQLVIMGELTPEMAMEHIVAESEKALK